MAQPGKRFESKFANSLHRLKGASMRIEDGGAMAKNQQFGDFFYWDLEGNDWLIECKSTHNKSFPIANLRKEQMAMLRTFDTLGGKRHSMVAINFYGENIREMNECILITYRAYETLVAKAISFGRASIPAGWLAEFGIIQERCKGNEWTLDFQSVLEKGEQEVERACADVRRKVEANRQ